MDMEAPSDGLLPVYILLVYERESLKNDYHKRTTNNNYKKPQKDKKIKKNCLKVIIIIVITRPFVENGFCGTSSVGE